MQVLTKDEIQRFLIQAKYEGYYELFLPELGTGARRGEILALRWDDLNFKTGELRIERQVCTINGELHISTPKTKSSVRMVELPPSLVNILAEYRRTVYSKWIFPHRWIVKIRRQDAQTGKTLVRWQKTPLLAI